MKGLPSVLGVGGLAAAELRGFWPFLFQILEPAPFVVLDSGDWHDWQQVTIPFLQFDRVSGDEMQRG